MAFEGFSSAGLAVLEKLRAHNTKATFEAHRADYQSGLLEPAKAFVVELAAVLQTSISPGIVAEPKTNGSIFRLNRDTRFSKDKSPYKTHFAMFLWEGPSRKTSSGFYMQLDAQQISLGVGHMAIGDLERYRRAVADDDTGVALVEALATAQAAWPDFRLSEPQLKRVPRGFDADHPRGTLLRHKVLHGMMSGPLPDQIHTAAFLDWAVERYEPLGDLHRWLVEHT